MVRGGGGHACQILECWFFICGHFRCERSWRKAVHIFDVIHHLGIKFHGFRCFNKKSFPVDFVKCFSQTKKQIWYSDGTCLPGLAGSRESLDFAKRSWHESCTSLMQTQGPLSQDLSRNARKIRGYKIQAVTMRGFQKGSGDSEKSTALQPCRPQKLATYRAALASLDYCILHLHFRPLQCNLCSGSAELPWALQWGERRCSTFAARLRERWTGFSWNQLPFNCFTQTNLPNFISARVAIPRRWRPAVSP